MGLNSASCQCFMGIDASRSLRSVAHHQNTVNKSQTKSISVKDRNAPEQEIEDRSVGITAKIDYQNPNPPN